jgi:biotin carboxylase
MDDNWLVSICAGWQQKQSILSARNLGVKVIAFDADTKAPCRSLVDLFFVIDIHDSKAIIKKIEQLQITPVAAASFISDLGMRTAGIINDYFKTGGMSEELAKKLTNKKLQRMCWDSLSMFNPKWKCVKSLSPSKVENLLDQFIGPVMVKPIDSAGSRGIFKINEPSVNDMPLLKDALEYSIEREIIIEEYINGREFSIESFWNNGNCEILAIGERTILHDRTASAIIYTTLPNKTKNIIMDATIRANLALGVRFGLTHTELILDKENKPFLLETAGRGGGFYVFDELVQKITDMDYSKIYIRQLMKQKPANYVTKKKKEAAIKYLSSELGVIKSVLGFNEANQIKGVKAECFVKKGDTTKSCINDADRLGYILVYGKSKSELDYLFMKAESLIEISYY